ncbi:hypothetical protein DHB64_06685 [Antarcticibacterium sp. W02-3]|nr:hypothetical protein [Antarcticibacterium sp. W02-3]
MKIEFRADVGVFVNGEMEGGGVVGLLRIDYADLCGLRGNVRESKMPLLSSSHWFLAKDHLEQENKKRARGPF